MLVLSRTKGQQIVIGTPENPITITVVEIRGDKVRLGIEADRQTPVHRAEIWAQIHGERRLKKVCSWCQLVMDEGDPGADVSHGICERCKVKHTRTRSQVLEARKHAVSGGCCDRFADQMPCDCLENALPG